VLALGEPVAYGLAVESKLGADLHQLRAGVNDLGALDLGVELEHARGAPAAA
jgi:hypothetical protein